MHYNNYIKIFERKKKMKKIIAIALTLTIILALAVSPSAASLSSNWEEIWNMVDGSGCGELVVNGKGEIYFDNELDVWHSAIAAVYQEKVKVDGLEMQLNIENLFNAPDPIWLPACLGPVVTVGLSAEKGTTLLPHDANGNGDYDPETFKNTMAGNKVGLDTLCEKTAAVTFTLVENDTDYGIFGGMASAVKVGYDAPVKTSVKSGDDFILKFVVDGEDVKILINGVETGVTFKAAAVLDADGKAYLAFTSINNGTAPIGLTVRNINGKAANEFDGSEGTCPPIGGGEDTPSSSEPAPSEPAPSNPTASAPAENKGGCGNKA